MRLSTIVTLVVGAFAAIFSYTPTAAAWLTIGREQGYVPETLPAEVTEPPVMGAAILTVLTFVVVAGVRIVGGLLGWSPFRTAVVAQRAEERLAEVVQQAMPSHGKTIIQNRVRLRDNREEIKVAEEAMKELSKEKKIVAEDLDAVANLLSLAVIDQKRAADEMARRERDVQTLNEQQREARERNREIDAQLSALSAERMQLLMEQRDLA